jgi:SAM-dependent methyltransferase
MSADLRRIAKGSKTAIIAYKIIDNWRWRRRLRRGIIESENGATHRAFSLEESLAYVNSQFDDYLRYGRLAAEDLRGLRVFELGFGDNIGVALRFLAAGAARVVCLDKFYSVRDEEQHRRVYLALREGLSAEERARFDEAIDLGAGLKVNDERLHCVYGTTVEESEELRGEAGRFDLAVSRGAIQDIYEPDAAFDAMDDLLAPGGRMLHKIDMSDQGMFSVNGMNPLTFLTISDGVYRMMAVDSSKPNRKTVDYYRRKMSELGYETQILVTELAGRERKGDLHPHKERPERGVDYGDDTLAVVREVRPRLNPRYRNLSDEDLMVAGIFIIARKPAR